MTTGTKDRGRDKSRRWEEEEASLFGPLLDSYAIPNDLFPSGDVDFTGAVICLALLESLVGRWLPPLLSG